MTKNKKPLVQINIDRRGTVLDSRKRAEMANSLGEAAEKTRNAVKQTSRSAWSAVQDNPKVTIAATTIGAAGALAVGAYLKSRQAS